MEISKLTRRDFLKMLGIGAATVAAPKFIFDMGKNSRLYAIKGLYDHPRLVMPEYVYLIPNITSTRAAKIYQLAEIDRLCLLEAAQIKELAALT